MVLTYGAYSQHGLQRPGAPMMPPHAFTMQQSMPYAMTMPTSPPIMSHLAAHHNSHGEVKCSLCAAVLNDVALEHGNHLCAATAAAACAHLQPTSSPPRDHMRT